MPQHHEYPRILSLTLALLLLLWLERDVFPPVFGIIPSFLLPFTVSVGITEGPLMGGGFGAAAGLLFDQGVRSAYGFTALLFMVVGVAAGLFISYFRITAVTAVFFTAVSALFVFTLKWFFLYFIWHSTGWYFRIVPLQILYAALVGVPVFLLIRRLSQRFGTLKKGS